MMMHLKRTSSEDAGFRDLVSLLDADLAGKNGDTNTFYAQFNKIDHIKHVVVCYDNSMPVGCGAFKAFHESAVEIKRMFVKPEQRGKGIGASVLQELEDWAKELGYIETILETGKQNAEAIQLYKKSGYEIMPNFGQYAGVEDSVCMKKNIG